MCVCMREREEKREGALKSTPCVSGFLHFKPVCVYGMDRGVTFGLVSSILCQNVGGLIRVPTGK